MRLRVRRWRRREEDGEDEDEAFEEDDEDEGEEEDEVLMGTEIFIWRNTRLKRAEEEDEDIKDKTGIAMRRIVVGH